MGCGNISHCRTFYINDDLNHSIVVSKEIKIDRVSLFTDHRISRLPIHAK